MFFKWFQLLILTSHAVLIVYLLYSISMQLTSITNSQDFSVELMDLYLNSYPLKVDK